MKIYKLANRKWDTYNTKYTNDPHIFSNASLIYLQTFLTYLTTRFKIKLFIIEKSQLFREKCLFKKIPIDGGGVP